MESARSLVQSALKNSRNSSQVTKSGRHERESRTKIWLDSSLQFGKHFRAYQAINVLCSTSRWDRLTKYLLWPALFGQKFGMFRVVEIQTTEDEWYRGHFWRYRNYLKTLGPFLKALQAQTVPAQTRNSLLSRLLTDARELQSPVIRSIWSTVSRY